MRRGRAVRRAYAPAANFSSQSHTAYYDIGLYGTGCLLVDDVIGRSLLYRAVHLSEVYISDDAAGRVDTVHRKQNPRIRHIAERFGVDAMPPKLRDLLEKGKGEDRVCVLHCVRPNGNYDPGRADMRGKRPESYYVVPEERAVLQEGGYHTMPYCVGRYATLARESYGRARACSRVRGQDAERHAEDHHPRREDRRAADAGLRRHHARVRQPRRRDQLRRPRLSGQPAQKPLLSGARVDIGMDQILEARRTINSVFHIDLFQVLVDKPAT